MQKLLGMNTHTTPRVDGVKDYLKLLQQRDTQRDREQFADKGRDTLLDGYSEGDLEKICCNLWARGQLSPECYLRTLVDLLLGHYMLTRGGDRRAAELSDLFTFELQGEGPTRCQPLILTTRASKQNQHGRLETMGALRHKNNPTVCVLSALAYYLLYRWDLTDEPFPDFSTRSAWYETRVIKRTSGDRTQELSYTSQREWMATAFREVGITTTMMTHVPRSAAPKIAEMKGVSEEQIRRAGRWTHEQMIGCYLNCLPREFMRTIAGHLAQPGCYEVRRAAIKPPDALLSLIWPGLDVWQGRFGPKTDQIDDLAATGLTNLLFSLREVILQDSVVLRLAFPNHAVWTHKVFEHSEYKTYARQVIAYQDDDSTNHDRLSILYQAVPQLMDYLKAMEGRNIQREARIEQYNTEIKALVNTIHESQAAQSSQLSLLTSGSLTFRLEAPTAAARQLQLQEPVAAVVTLNCSSGGSTSTLTSSSTSRSTPSPQPQAILQAEERPPPAYRMSRAVKTVARLWDEWTIGLAGCPSIQELDSRWGSRWRAGRRSEIQWYSLRLEVIKEIRRIAQIQRIGEEAAMARLNLQQQKIGCSLDQLCKQLRRRSRS
jgi:hypothetical protein